MAHRQAVIDDVYANDIARRDKLRVRYNHGVTRYTVNPDS